MNVKVDIDINTARIIKSRGLDGPVQKFLASEVIRLSDKYVPFESGILKNSAKVVDGGRAIVYPGPYAHYQWVGKVMGPNWQDKEGNWHSGKAPKRYTGEMLNYNGATRGPRWTERMMADKSHELTKSVAAYVGGK